MILWAIRPRHAAGLLAAIAVVSAAVLFAPATSSHGADDSAKAPAPQWIWLNRDVKPNESVYFRKIVKLPGDLKSAVLLASCDNELTAYVNGIRVLRHTSWENPGKVDIKKHLREGDNLIAIEGRNDASSAAGLLVEVIVKPKEGEKQTIVSDASWVVSATKPSGWETATFDTSSWKKAHSFGKVGVAPWGAVGLPGTPSRPGSEATAPGQITLVRDFKAELLYSVPKDSEGSWVSMTNDARGRLICSDQSGALYRVTPGANAESTKVERLSLPIGDAQGLLWAFDSLYVVVNGGAAQGSGLYRCQDTNGDGELDSVKLLRKLDGGGEHGPHAVKLGPDGKLWIIAGNFTKAPKINEAQSPLRNWSEDHLLPRNPDGNGFATGLLAPGGWICNTDAEGKEWNLFCGGFRNPYDIDFNQDGELFTYDADMEWDTGTPWYRPTRVNHAVSAAEFGWRYGTGKWPAYYPDSLGAVVDIGLGSPTGIAFGTGAKFPAKYQRALFINDWTYGKIYAVHMKPTGASYTADFEVFAEAKPLPVTDIVVNTDGALYFTIGGRGTQSGLYRVTYHGAESTEKVGPIVDEAATKARATRHELEAYHLKQDPKAVELAWPYLNSSDRSLRYAARVALEHQDPALWQEKALGETRTTATTQLMIALARTAKPEMQSKIVARLNSLPYAKMTEEQLLEAMRAYGLTFTRLGKPKAEDAKSVAERLSPLFPSQDDFVNRELCQVLLYVNAPGVVEKTMALLKASSTQQERMHYGFVLRNAREGWTPELRKAYFLWLQFAEAKGIGGASFKNFIIRIRKDAVDTLSDADKVAYKDVIEGRLKGDANNETTRQFVHNWQLEDLVPLVDQVESGRSFEHGREAFHAAQCYKCHRFAGDGGSTGPDLTGAGNRFSSKDILESIVAPSKVISDQYKGTSLTTVDGEVIAGRIIEETDKIVRIRTSPFAKELTEVKVSDIESRRPATISEMPQGAINVLTKEEVLDLVAYLRSAGNPQDKAFKKK